MKAIILSLITLISLSAEAKIFRNAYIAFELPDTWKCNLEHTEWVCRSESDKESKEAIIILTAKEAGPTDSFDSYSQHLALPQTSGPNKTVISKVVYPPKQNKINDQIWVDGLHVSSEVNNYYTRYLATIKDQIAILVTFSAHKNFYTKYSPDFIKAVQSLRVIATKNLLAKPESGPLRPGGETLGAPIGAAMPSDLAAIDAPNGDLEKSKSGAKTKMLFMSVAFILIVVAGYIFVKLKQR